MSNMIRTMSLIVVIVLLAAACGGGDGYSEKSRDDFMRGCEPAAGTAYCECAFVEIEATFTEDEYLEMGETFPDVDGRNPAALDDAVAPCWELWGN